MLLRDEDVFIFKELLQFLTVGGFVNFRFGSNLRLIIQLNLIVVAQLLLHQVIIQLKLPFGIDLTLLVTGVALPSHFKR